MAKQDGEGKATDFLTWVPTERIPGTWFRLLRFIDEGGHGRLYQVEHEITGRVCAFKAIHRRFRTFAHLEARLRQEANVNTRLSGHPNIAEVFDAGVTEDGRTYCVMQWLEGTSLRNVLKHGMGLDVDWACFVVKSVLSALARAHSLGIVHRDIKPANIFLCDDGLVKLIDFGIAKVFNSKFIKTDPLLLPCTYQYMSPESADGQDVTSSSDLYSLGVVFWEMLAGEHPFQRYTLPKDVVLAIVRDGVPPLDNMPKAVARTTAALRQVVMRACAQEPSERFPSAEAFFEAIDVAMGYAAPPQPIASGFRPPASLARSAAPKPPSSPRTAVGLLRAAYAVRALDGHGPRGSGGPYAARRSHRPSSAVSLLRRHVQQRRRPSEAGSARELQLVRARARAERRYGRDASARPLAFGALGGALRRRTKRRKLRHLEPHSTLGCAARGARVCGRPHTELDAAACKRHAAQGGRAPFLGRR
jgi:eukaryotic-like serine/threonine-protein kinase